VARAYLGLGSNLGDRLAGLRAALAALADPPRLRVTAVSPVWETEPLAAEPPAYLNAACEVVTDLEPSALLARLLAIETGLRRTRARPGAPRPLDLDLLLYDDRVVREPGVIVPHPRLRERRFVLAPLCAIAPALRHPATGERLADLLAALPDHGARRSALDLG
jgi:2-amino-4-hydroxy-6-hydroxymethyldihydropteridine diphosphokinase